jgi:hypothetical protein
VQRGAQPLDFLDPAKNFTFLFWKLASAQVYFCPYGEMTIFSSKRVYAQKIK